MNPDLITDEQALEIKEKALGPEHPDTALSLDKLAALLLHLGRHADAEPLYRRALAILEKALPGHPNTQTCAENLRGVIKVMGKRK